MKWEFIFNKHRWYALGLMVVTAVLGWFDGADWMNIVAYSLAVTGLILWGWYHFSVRCINEELKQNISDDYIITNYLRPYFNDIEHRNISIKPGNRLIIKNIEFDVFH